MENNNEIWKPIIYNGVDYTGIYEVSSLGRVRKCSDLKIRKQRIWRGYKLIDLYKNKNRLNIAVHRIVATSFLGEIPKDKIIDHVNNDKADNRVENLQFLSNRENISKFYKNTRYLPVGVRFAGEKYKSIIGINEIYIYLGTYDNKHQAKKAYEIALGLIEKANVVKCIKENINNYRLSIGLNPIKRK